MVRSSAFEALRHLNRAQRLAGIRYLWVWVMEYGCLNLYARCDVTHTRLRVSGTHPSSVCLCKLTRARASLGRTLGSMVFSRNTIQLTSGRRRRPDQSATQLESNNQRSSSTSPGLSPRWYKQPYPWTQRSNTGPQPRWNPLEGSLQLDFACTMTSNGLAITGPQTRW
jgi:hypothetical protein